MPNQAEGEGGATCSGLLSYPSNHAFILQYRQPRRIEAEQAGEDFIVVFAQ
jgi:hypothetical protein